MECEIQNLIKCYQQCKEEDRRRVDHYIQSFEVNKLLEIYVKLKEEGQADEVTDMEAKIRNHIQPLYENIKKLIHGKARMRRSDS